MAIINYLMARKNGGSFILRIEDTDRNRLVPGSAENIIDTLEQFGLRPDEGLRGGECSSIGPTQQLIQVRLGADCDASRERRTTVSVQNTVHKKVQSTWDAPAERSLQQWLRSA